MEVTLDTNDDQKERNPPTNKPSSILDMLAGQDEKDESQDTDEETTVPQTKETLDPDDEFGFIGAEGPPTMSLLVADLLPVDAAVRSHLNDVLKTCGSTASTAQMSRLFELEAVLSSGWPEVLPVVCL